MNYKEYKATDGKILLNLRDFHYGNTILCGNDINLSLIEVTKEDAEYINAKYQSGIKAINNSREDNIEEQIDTFRLSLMRELIEKGYSLNSIIGGNNSDIEQQIRDLLNE